MKNTSKWLTVDQAMIDRFAEATLDPDPMHINPEWCAENSPFGGTIAFGFLTLSLLTHLGQDIIRYARENRSAVDGVPLNYGFNKVRMITPVPVNSRIRMVMHPVSSVLKAPGQTMQTSDIEVQIEGQEKPALVAQWLTIWVDPGEGVAALKKSL